MNSSCIFRLFFKLRRAQLIVRSERVFGFAQSAFIAAHLYQPNSNSHFFCTDSTLPSSTTSVIRPFLYDTILSPTQLPTKYLEDDYYSIPFYPPELSVNLPPYRSNMLDNPNMNMQSMNGGTMNGGGVAGKMYSAVPPPGYICKLWYVSTPFTSHHLHRTFSLLHPSFVEGHWLKNCTQYQSRRSSQPLFPLTTPLKPTPQSQSLYRPQKTSTPPPGYVCRKCNTPGHWIQQCVIPNRSLNGPPEGYTCKICWVKGHWIGQCPLRGRC